MGKKAHTPGPWSIIPNGWQPWENAIEIAADDNRGPVCFTATRDGGDPSHADARLIAAAPDLLEALEALLPEIDSEIEQRKTSGNDEYWQGLQALADSAKATLSKATGGL